MEPIIIRLPFYLYTKLETFVAPLPCPSSPFFPTSHWCGGFLLPLCPLASAHLTISLSRGRAPQPQISFRNRRRGGRERRRRERRDERGAGLQDEYEEKENGPKFSRNFGLRFGLLEERSRTRASAAAAAGRHREGERRCPRQAPARGVGEDRGLNRWGGLLSVRADLQILPRPA